MPDLEEIKATYTVWSNRLLCLKGGVGIEERKRQKTENRVGRASREYCQVYYSKFLYTTIKRGEKAKLPYQRYKEQTDVIISSKPKTSSNHTLIKHSVV